MYQHSRWLQTLCNRLYFLYINSALRHRNDVHWQVQYIPRNMHTVFALLCFVVVIHWLISPYPSGLLHWHCGNLTIAPVPAKQPWWIWINTSYEFIMNDCITTTKQSTTKPCANFLGYTVVGLTFIILLLGQPCVRRSKSYWCISPNSLAPCDSLLVWWSLLMLPSDQLDPRYPFYLLGWTLIPAWISNYIHYKLLDEITYPFLNFNGCTVEV